MKEVYEKLYDIMSENLKKYDDKSCFSKKAFISVTENPTIETDIETLKTLNNEEFLQASYMAYFNRTIDDGAMSSWHNKLKEDSEKFRSQVTNQLVRSFEFKLNNSKVINNCYERASLQNVKIRNNRISRLVLLKLYSVYSKTLRPIKVELKNKFENYK